jgi:hypothetical protein
MPQWQRWLLIAFGVLLAYVWYGATFLWFYP